MSLKVHLTQTFPYLRAIITSFDGSPPSLPPHYCTIADVEANNGRPTSKLKSVWRETSLCGCEKVWKERRGWKERKWIWGEPVALIGFLTRIEGSKACCHCSHWRWKGATTLKKNGGETASEGKVRMWEVREDEGGFCFSLWRTPRSFWPLCHALFFAGLLNHCAVVHAVKSRGNVSLQGTLTELGKTSASGDGWIHLLNSHSTKAVLYKSISHF